MAGKAGDKYLTAYYVGSDSGFRIEVISVKVGLGSVDGPLAALNYADASDNCCLSCMGRLVCGYAVSTEFGCCFIVLRRLILNFVIGLKFQTRNHS